MKSLEIDRFKGELWQYGWVRNQFFNFRQVVEWTRDRAEMLLG